MKIKVEFEIELNNDFEYTEEQLNEYLRFEFGDNGVMSSKNPFDGQSVEPVFGTFYWSQD